jgi:hypothetical protein
MKTSLFMESNVTLIPFSSTDVDLLRHWMTAPHVAMWYPEAEDHIRPILKLVYQTQHRFQSTDTSERILYVS